MVKIYIIPILLLFSCASSKPNCEAYGKDDFLVEQIKIPLQMDTLLYKDTIYKPLLDINGLMGQKNKK
jgi:hypothetical protein